MKIDVYIVPLHDCFKNGPVSEYGAPIAVIDVLYLQGIRGIISRTCIHDERYPVWIATPAGRKSQGS